VSRRDYIPYPQRLAAALACLLPPMRRDELRRHKATAADVIAHFQFDHIKLHALEANDPDRDRWFNLDPKEVGPHRIKSARDTAIVAKVARIRVKREAIPKGPGPCPECGRRPEDACELCLRVAKQLQTKQRKRKRKIGSRGFPKGHRPMRRRL